MDLLEANGPIVVRIDAHVVAPDARVGIVTVGVAGARVNMAVKHELSHRQIDSVVQRAKVPVKHRVMRETAKSPIDFNLLVMAALPEGAGLEKGCRFIVVVDNKIAISADDARQPFSHPPIIGAQGEVTQDEELVFISYHIIDALNERIIVLSNAFPQARGKSLCPR